MKPSEKQYNALRTACFYAIGHLTKEERDEILEIAKDDMVPEDITVLVGDMIALAYKDFRDGVEETDKTRIADEVRSIIKQYARH